MVKLEVCLFFGASVDCGENGGVFKIHIAVLAMFLVASDSRHVPLASSNVAFMLRHPSFGFASSFSNVGISGVVLAITVEFIYHLPGGKFRFILPT